MDRRFVLLLLVAAGCGRAAQHVPTTATQRRVVRREVVEQTDLRNAKIREVIPLEARVLDDSAIGDEVARDGSVTGAKRQFPAGQPLYLMMRFRESPGGLDAGIRLLDASKKNVFGDLRAMKGRKQATFTIPATVVRPGHYTIEGYWGANLVCTYAVDVVRSSEMRTAAKPARE